MLFRSGSPRRPQWVGPSLGSRGLIPAGPRARPRGTQGSCGLSSRPGCCLGSTEAAASFLPPPTSRLRCFLFWRPLPSSLCTSSTPHALTPPPPSQHFPNTPPDTAAPPRSLLFLGNTNARGQSPTVSRSLSPCSTCPGIYHLLLPPAPPGFPRPQRSALPSAGASSILGHKARRASSSQPYPWAP